MVKRLVWGFLELFCTDCLFFFSPSISSCLDNICFYRCLRTSNCGFQMEERILSFQPGTHLGPIITWNNVPLLTLLSLESDIGTWYLSILSLLTLLSLKSDISVYLISYLNKTRPNSFSTCVVVSKVGLTFLTKEAFLFLYIYIYIYRLLLSFKEKCLFCRKMWVPLYSLPHMWKKCWDASLL